MSEPTSRPGGSGGSTFDLHPRVAGSYIDGSIVPAASITAVATGRIYLGHIRLPSDGYSIDRIGIMVATGAASSSVILGIYNADTEWDPP